MVQMTITATNNLQCSAVHGPSGTVITTDAPSDVGGNASAFSPTDLVGVALVTCILTTMGLVANKLGLDLTGATGSVEKIMGTEKPRRIRQLDVVLNIPLNPGEAVRERLEHAAHSCPVHHSLHPDIVKNVTIHWGNH
jgi:putative redox protein